MKRNRDFTLHHRSQVLSNNSRAAENILSLYWIELYGKCTTAQVRARRRQVRRNGGGKVYDCRTGVVKVFQAVFRQFCLKKEVE